VVPAALPLFHIGGSIIFGFLPLAHGASLVIPSPAGFRDKLVIANYWRLAERYRFTLMSCVPTVLAALNQVSVGDSDISSFRLCITGGSTVPVETCKRFAERSGMPVIEGYGMTEAASYVTVHPIGAPQRFGTVGGPLPGISIEVRPMGQEADKGPLPPGEVGVVVVEGDCVTPGYIDDHHNAGVLLGPGCFNSGDLGRMGDDGVLTLVGRAKDVIIRGGHNIDPVTIEETLAAHPDVNTVAAVGQPDGYAGELPVAYVTVRQDADVDAETLRQYARAQIVERAAAPVQVTILEDMPVTGVGKIFKPQLRMDAAVQVVRRLLEPMGRNYGFEARVGARMVDHALTVDIALPPSLPQAVVREIAGKLGELPIAYQVNQD
jgi:fatty-acyl-CoA synthase